MAKMLDKFPFGASEPSERLPKGRLERDFFVLHDHLFARESQKNL